MVAVVILVVVVVVAVAAATAERMRSKVKVQGMAIVRSVNSTLDLVLACPGIHTFCGMFRGHILHGLLNKACIGAFLVHSLTGGAMM